ncbi:hypothetical protein CFP56_015252 [Quercus suber]|uniref:Uncharacterized protein n=1 Tax=Quercus suber TaxID=58331 RepID=A0AAW0M572_QUESU
MNPHALVVQKRTLGTPSSAAASRVKLMTPSETMQVTGGTWEEEVSFSFKRRPFPLRSAVAIDIGYRCEVRPRRGVSLAVAIEIGRRRVLGLSVEFSLTDEAITMEISNSDLTLFFFFLQLWIPCDCDYG